MLNGKSILITGGTGSFGKKITEIILKRYPQIKRLVIYSRDELKQYEMSHKYDTTQYPQIRYFIGDIRDYNVVNKVTKSCSVIYHFAALLGVDIVGHNHLKTMEVESIGLQNIVKAAIKNQVEKIIYSLLTALTFSCVVYY